MTKIRLSLLAAVLYTTLFGCATQKETPLEGTWQMESGSYADTQLNQVIETNQEQRFSIKIMGPKHFAVVEMFKAQPDSLFFAAVGTYKVSGQKYMETYEASNVGYQVGTSREFESILKQDRWIITRSQENMELREVWVRM